MYHKPEFSPLEHSSDITDGIVIYDNPAMPLHAARRGVSGSHRPSHGQLQRLSSQYGSAKSAYFHCLVIHLCPHMLFRCKGLPNE